MVSDYCSCHSGLHGIEVALSSFGLGFRQHYFVTRDFKLYKGSSIYTMQPGSSNAVAEIPEFLWSIHTKQNQSCEKGGLPESTLVALSDES